MQNEKPVPSMKSIITNSLKQSSFWLIIVFIILMAITQMMNANIRGRATAQSTIWQVEKTLDENKRWLEKMREDYRVKCLKNAQSIAYIIEKDYSLINDETGLQRIAWLLGVDEINIFDRSGTIIGGTAPEYYGLNMDAGEQISFFKPLLKDSSLELHQEIMPNTADKKLMQYSALWSSNQRFIVQVGMFPINGVHSSESSEMSYIFSLLNTSQEGEVYIVSLDTNIVKASTQTGDVGKHISKVGLSPVEFPKNNAEFFAEINGRLSLCVFQKSNDSAIVSTIPVAYLYDRIPFTTVQMVLALLLIATFLMKISLRQLDELIVLGIAGINDGLRKMAGSRETVLVKADTCEELKVLCSHINNMTASMMDMRQQIEAQRDRDAMTGLYNRYGLAGRIKEIFSAEENIKHSAFVMVDADDLKRLNDDYGHEIGDVYLRKLGDFLANIDDGPLIAARYGGDEFVLFFYRRESRQALDAAINKLKTIRDKATIELSDTMTIILRFSYGLAYYTEGTNYQAMLKIADDNMYEEKRQRKADRR